MWEWRKLEADQETLINWKEIEVTISKMKMGRTAGIDEIPGKLKICMEVKE